MKTSTQVFAFSLVIPFFVAFLIVAHPAFAQFPGGAPAGLSLLAYPQFPEAFEKVKVSLDDYSVDTLGADIVWVVDGIRKQELTNERSIELEAGNLGTRRTVRVNIVRNGMIGMSTSIAIIPTQVDLILESDTYVPSFYEGRALPGPASKVRAVAVVHDGTETPDTTYTYKWTETGTVLFGGPVKGKNVVDFTTSPYGNRTLTVEVLNSEGATVGKKAMALETRAPEIHFYEESPLRGLIERAAPNPYPLIGEEVTIYGEPFFFNTRINDPEVEFRWGINGKEVTSESEMLNSITLRPTGGTGRAEVDMEVRTLGRIPQYIERAFTVFFE